MLKRIRFLSWRLLGEVWWHLLLKEQGEVGQAKGMGQRWQLSPKGTNYQKSWGKREHRMFRQQQVSRQTYLNSKHQKRFFFLIQWGKIFTHFPDSGGIIFFKPYLATFSSLLWQFLCVCVCPFLRSFIQKYIPCHCKSQTVNCSVGSNSLWPLDCSLPGSSVHGILQARILEWVAIFFSRISSQPRDRTWVFYIAGRFFIFWATREAPDQ